MPDTVLQLLAGCGRTETSRPVAPVGGVDVQKLGVFHFPRAGGVAGENSGADLGSAALLLQVEDSAAVGNSFGIEILIQFRAPAVGYGLDGRPEDAFKRHPRDGITDLAAR